MYKRLLAWGMARANRANENNIKLSEGQCSSMAALKRSLLANVQGQVLEIGPGAGINLSYFPKDIQWIGIEPNPFMHFYLKQEAQRQGIKSIQLFNGTAERLPVEDSSIDTVVSTYVLCSVENPQASLQEIQRVLKPGGTFIFLEHVASEGGTRERKIQDLVEPAWACLFDHCHPNRETWKVLEEEGFEAIECHPYRLSFPIISPQIAGLARKQSVIGAEVSKV